MEVLPSRSAKVVVGHARPGIGTPRHGGDVEPEEGDEGDGEGEEELPWSVTSLALITDLDFLSGYSYCRPLRVTCQAVYSGYMPRTTESHRASDDHHHGMSLDDTSDFMNTLEYEIGFPRRPPRDVRRCRPLADRPRLLPRGPRAGVARGLRHDRGPGAGEGPTRPAAPSARSPTRSPTTGRRTDDALAEVNRAIRSRERDRARQGGRRRLGRPQPCRRPARRRPRPPRRPARPRDRGGHSERVRICANDTCRWVFFDAVAVRSPPLVRHGDAAATGPRRPATGPGRRRRPTAATERGRRVSARRARSAERALEERPDLGREPRHRLLVVRRREARR